MIRVGASWMKGNGGFAPYRRDMAVNTIGASRGVKKVHIIKIGSGIGGIARAGILK
jgi:hypothetical protein